MESTKHYDVVITTYSTLAREWQVKRRRAAIFEKHWHRVILDEGEHRLSFSGEILQSNTDR